MAKKHLGESKGKIFKFPSHVMIMFRLFARNRAVANKSVIKQQHQ